MVNTILRTSPRQRKSNADFSAPLSPSSSLGSVSSSERMSLQSSRRRRIKRKQKSTASPFTFCIFVMILTTTVFFRMHISSRRASEKSQFARYSETAPACEAIDEITLTLVTQLSYDRLWMMQYHCERWGAHPISIAVYTELPVTRILLELQNMNCPLEHLTVQALSGYSKEDYPVNVLRNTALSAVRTTHVVYVDVDFWESTDLYETVMLHEHVLLDTKTALVIPAFQLDRQCVEWVDCRENNIPVMPRNKEELVRLIREDSANAFDPTNVGGHGSTRYKEWATQDHSELVPIDCVLSNRYEPYLVFRYCHDLPPFQEAFTGYGKNKMTWVMQLRRSGWKLLQLGGAFIIHYPHLDSAARMAWNGGEDGKQLAKPIGDNVDWMAYKRGRTDQVFLEFREWLKTTVPNQMVVGKCQKYSLNDDEKLWVRRKTEAR